MKRVLLALAVVLALVAPASAMTLTQTGATFTVEYDEPTTNADGTVLDDLDHTSIYVKVGAGAESKVAEVPASALGGGAHVSKSIDVAIQDGVVVDVTVSVSASDQSGNESVRSASVTRRVDKLAPSAPR